MTTPETLSQSDFARHLRLKKSYVSHLKTTGRLVLTEDGKAVRVAESIAMIEASKDPSKVAVAERHAAQREAAAGVVADSTPIASPAVSGDGGAGGSYQTARAVREKFLALAAKRDYEVSLGKLLDAAQVEGAVSAATTQFRAALEAIPYDLAPELAPITDEGQVRALLVDALERALTELARQMGRVTQQETNA